MPATATEPAADLFAGFEFQAAPPREEIERIAAENGQRLSEIAPGVWVAGMPEFEIPSHVICRLVPVPEKPGTYTLTPEPYPGFVRMSDDIGKRLGVIGLSVTTMRRLLWGDYVEHIRPAPDCIFISIESLLDHFRRTRNDCARETSFWNRSRRDHWRSICECSNKTED